jgi:lysophospholipase L1-like esterase
MKNILCFGDSNTWGYTPISGVRYLKNERWPSVLQNIVGRQFHIIEEGLNGRTIANNVEGRPARSGAEILPILLESHRPLDLVIVSLGTNDLLKAFDLSAKNIARNMKVLCLSISNNEFIAQQKCKTKILVISPPHLGNLPKEDKLLFNDGHEKSKQLAIHYEKLAEELDVNFMDAQDIIQTSDIDGIHWTTEQHQEFAEAISKKVIRLLES